MKYFSIALTLFALLSSGFSSFAQLVIKGIIYSDNMVLASVKPDHSSERELLYMYPAKKSEEGSDFEFSTKYEVPQRLVANENYTIRFNDGKVEKLVYVSGAIPKDIVPKQKFRIDIDLVSSKESDMTLIVFWSMSQTSYRALPLSEINEIRADAHPDFLWQDGTIPEEQTLRTTSN